MQTTDSTKVGATATSHATPNVGQMQGQGMQGGVSSTGTSQQTGVQGTHGLQGTSGMSSTQQMGSRGVQGGQTTSGMTGGVSGQTGTSTGHGQMGSSMSQGQMGSNMGQGQMTHGSTGQMGQGQVSPWSVMTLDPFSTSSLFSPMYGGGMLGMPNMSSMLSNMNLGSMAIDMTETDNGFKIMADIPGFKKEDIRVEVDNNTNMLHISSNTGPQVVEEDKTIGGTRWHTKERSSKSIYRSIRLPTGANRDQIRANVNNGVLCVEIPKVAGETTTRKTITVA